ncbi:hypothetical protein BgiBS90_021623 [Biomphalaria glabrata]|nr:hypothetical protein BgiBS90_021623 [Biomphalaria glabrata]
MDSMLFLDAYLDLGPPVRCRTWSQVELGLKQNLVSNRIRSQTELGLKQNLVSNRTRSQAELGLKQNLVSSRTWSQTILDIFMKAELLGLLQTTPYK